MSGLAHVFEAAGIPTTLISLVRPHTEKMRPPRALWVPFELGRPFGPPDDAAFQTRVLEHALRLLEAPAGPVLEDFPDDAPGNAEADPGWSCPVQFGPPPTAADSDELQQAVQREMALLSPWYERACTARGRTTVGISGLSLPEVLPVLCAALERRAPAGVDAQTLADTVRLAAEDLKAYYTEAATAQPGARSSDDVLRWFWHDTSASVLLRALRTRYADSDEAPLRLLGTLLLVPRSQSGEPA